MLVIHFNGTKNNLLLMILCVVSKRVFCFFSYSESLSNSGNRTGENDLVPYSIMVLTSWDHSLVSGEAVSNLSKGITNTLKVATTSSLTVASSLDIYRTS